MDEPQIQVVAEPPTEGAEHLRAIDETVRQVPKPRGRAVRRTRATRARAKGGR